MPWHGLVATWVSDLVLQLVGMLSGASIYETFEETLVLG